MAKKQSFADKSSKKGKSLGKFVKYVKSILSKKSGNWRFNEQIVNIKDGENLDSALKRINEEKWDSLAHVNLIVAIESEFKLRLKPHQIENMNSFKSILMLIKKK